MGFIDIYELIYKQKAIAIIHYLPQHGQTKQRVVFTLIPEGKKRDWTEGRFWIKSKCDKALSL